jgi:hypothetical protein
VKCEGGVTKEVKFFQKKKNSKWLENKGKLNVAAITVNCSSKMCSIYAALAFLKKNHATLRAKCVQTTFLVGRLFGSRREEIKDTNLHLAMDF